MMRKWFCVLIVLCLLLSGLPQGALATEPADGTQPSTEASTTPPTEPPTEPTAAPPTDAPTDPPTEPPTEPDPTGVCGENMNWTLDLDTGVLTISGSGRMVDCTSQPWGDHAGKIRKVVIESGVVSIGNEAFKKCTALTEVSIPASVTNMGKSVFAGCTSLKSVQIPAGITVIPYGTFSGSGLQSVGIPANILSIERHAFGNCASLTKLRFSGHAPSIEEDAFYEVKAEAVYPGTDASWMDKWQNYGGTISWVPDTPADSSGLFGNGFSWSFENGKLTITGKGHMRGWEKEEEVPWHHLRSKVTSVVMSGKIWSIYPWAFKDMAGLTEVTWPQDLNTIYASAFYNCTGLTKLDIPYSVTEIKDYAFYGCAGLSKLTLPSRLEYIGPGAFGGCKALQTLELPDTLKEIAKNAFYYSGLKSITIPKGVTNLPTGVFQGCKSLTEVTISGKVTGIGKQCFESCGKLKKLTLPAGLKTVSEEAFMDSGLTELVFEGDMPNFGSNALKGLTVKVYYPKRNDTWGDTRIEALQKGYTGVTCYAGTPGDAEKTTEPPTEAPTEAETQPVATAPVTEPEQETQSSQIQDSTETQAAPETEPEVPTQPQEEDGLGGAVLWLFIAAGIIALLCIGILVWIFLDYRARQKRKKNRKRKPMEWDT